MRGSLKAQAKARAAVGIPIVAIMLLGAWHWSGHALDGVIAGGIVFSSYCIYTLITLVLSNRQDIIASKQLVIATAIFDPLVLSTGLAVTNETGSLFVCFYLFTILGFGFRIGQRAMITCQIASIAGFGIVMAVAPIWHQHPLFGASFVSLLIVVPLYARILIQKLRDARVLAEN